MKKNIKLEGIRVKSFMTATDQKKIIKGGFWGGGHCFRHETCECTTPDECPTATC